MLNKIRRPAAIVALVSLFALLPAPALHALPTGVTAAPVGGAWGLIAAVWHYSLDWLGIGPRAGERVALGDGPLTAAVHKTGPHIEIDGHR